MRIIGSTKVALLLVPVLSGVAACTLINSYGEVLQSPLDGSMDDTGAGVEAGTDGSLDGGAHDSGFADVGVIVVSGQVADDAGNLEGVLTAIDPVSGAELPKAREAASAPVVLYDGDRDLWLIIESTSLYPSAGDQAILYTRTLDPVTGRWTTLQSLRVPAPVFNQAVVLYHRLAYVALVPDAGVSGAEELISIDTSDPTNPSLYRNEVLALPFAPIGIIGTRSTTQNGGVVNLLEALPCPADAGSGVEEEDGGDAATGGTGGGFCLFQQHAVEPNSDAVTLTLFDDLGPFYGKPAFGSYLSGGPVDVIMWAQPGGNASSPGATAIHEYVPQTLTMQGTPIPFRTTDGFFQPLAFAECQQQALMVSTNEDLDLYAIPLASATATPSRILRSQSGQSVYFEPFTSTVLTPFSQQDGYVLEAFTLGGSSSMPTLTKRDNANWQPPPDVRPELLGIRNPLPIVCP